jgi:hypothetical protein
LVQHHVGAEVDALICVVVHGKGARIALDPGQRLVEAVAAQQKRAVDQQFVSRFMER